MRQNGENVATFASELRQIAMYCDSGASLEEMLCDSAWHHDEHIQQHLLMEPNLTFQKGLGCCPSTRVGGPQHSAGKGTKIMQTKDHLTVILCANATDLFLLLQQQLKDHFLL